MPDHSNTPSPEDVLKPLLEPGESLVWSGKPDPAIYAWGANGKTAFILGLVWLLLSGGLYLLLSARNDESDLPSWAPPVIASAVAIPGLVMFMWHLVRRSRAKATCYGITQRHMIEVRGSGSSMIKDVRSPQRMIKPALTRHGDTLASITFHRAPSIWPGGRGPLDGFHGIARPISAMDAASALFHEHQGGGGRKLGASKRVTLWIRGVFTHAKPPETE